MKEEVIGRRYAKALILLGREEGVWKEVGEDLEAVAEVLEGDESLRGVLSDPVYDRKRRKAVLEGVLEKMGVGRICRNFLLLLVDKERLRYLPAILAAYRRLEDVLAGRLRARVVSARALDEQETAEIARALERRFQKEIILERQEDSGILGGVVCQVDGMVFDGSVRTQLESLRTVMKGE